MTKKPKPNPAANMQNQFDKLTAKLIRQDQPMFTESERRIIAAIDELKPEKAAEAEKPAEE